jgi:hypothetical protein
MGRTPETLVLPETSVALNAIENCGAFIYWPSIKDPAVLHLPNLLN